MHWGLKCEERLCCAQLWEMGRLCSLTENTRLLTNLEEEEFYIQVIESIKLSIGFLVKIKLCYKFFLKKERKEKKIKGGQSYKSTMVWVLMGV